ncbi:hypothetical protein AM363_02810 (plasmid) [Citrobacter freundii]|uniref:Uncharacterized protein n=1 Tax=Citrobacter freundii TaxID=546 RepID=A0AB33H2E3_CITFR|nr:hypothetical protein AM363_02810 [Citrobacter freundii]HBY8077675.1 hypothetical protein [Klebsiella pneumoniae]
MLSIKTSICCVCEAVKTVRAISTAWMKQGFPCFFHFCGSYPASSASFCTLSVMSSGSPKSQPCTGL